MSGLTCHCQVGRYYAIKTEQHSEPARILYFGLHHRTHQAAVLDGPEPEGGVDVVLGIELHEYRRRAVVGLVSDLGHAIQMPDATQKEGGTY